MPHYERRGEFIFDVEGLTNESTIRFSNGSKIYIQGGKGMEHNDHSFVLKFCSCDHDGGSGWWVNGKALDELIAELLYIRKDFEKVWGGDDPDVVEVEDIVPEGAF